MFFLSLSEHLSENKFKELHKTEYLDNNGVARNQLEYYISIGLVVL